MALIGLIGLIGLAATVGAAAFVFSMWSRDDDRSSRPEEIPTYPLPFGFEQVTDTVPLGRPQLVRTTQDNGGGTEGEIEMIRLVAVYAIETDDPEVPYRAWVNQISEVTGGTSASGQSNENQWLSTTLGLTVHTEGQGAIPYPLSYPNEAQLSLWPTTDRPLLMVQVTLPVEMDQPGAATLVPAVTAAQIDEMKRTLEDLTAQTQAIPIPQLGPDFTWPGPPGDQIPATQRTAGDELFTEQGSTMHLPADSTSLTPSLPVSAGTGGSFSVLSATDGAATVQALLDKGVEHGGDPDYVYDRSDEEHDGVRVIRGSFNIPAGGWGFDVISVQGEDDPEATVYVRSWAD